MYLKIWLKLLLTYFFIASFSAGNAQDNIDSIRKIISGTGMYEDKVNAYLAFGENFALKNFEETVKILNAGIGLSQKHKDDARTGNLKRQIGTAYYFKGEYNVAAKYYYDAISLLEITGQKKNLALAYNDLAKLYRKTRTLDRASVNYEKALTAFRQLNDSAGISMIQNESGVVYEYMHNYPEAIRRYTASYVIDKARDNKMGVSYALSNLAGVYVIQKKFKEAELFLKEALELRRYFDDSLSLAIIYSDIGNSFFSQKKYPEAILYTDSSNRIAKFLNYRELLTTNYRILSEISKEMGDYKQAYGFLEKRITIHDSLFDLEKLKQVEELNTKYETLQKEKIILQQQFEINRRNYWIGASSVFLLLAAIASLSYYKRVKMKQQSRLQQVVSQQQDIATRAILEAEEKERERIAKDLHDGIGQMMSVAKMNLSALETSIAFSGEKQELAYGSVINLVDESCKEIRNVSHNLMPNALVKQNLAEAFLTFSAQINQPGLEIKLFTEGLDKKINNNIETVLYRIIQECVNNVVKHANASRLDISVIKDQDGISATIEDDGTGFKITDPHFSGGIGIKNIKSRIQYLKGTVEFNSSPGEGVLVSLHIPLEK